MKINVGSKNPVKIEAVREAFNLFFNDTNIKGFSVNSGVSSQPKTLNEISQGAKNRAVNCFNDCDYGIGLESGIFPVKDSLTDYLNICCCAIYNGKKIVGIGISPGFEYPRFVIKKILQEKSETGKIFDELLNEENLNQKQGIVGVLAHDKYSRKDFTRAGVIMALYPLLNKKLYDKK